jgi:Tfp pilus assembly protein PilX
MRYLFEKARGNEGSVTVIALLILVVLTILGVAATITSRTEVQIAGNDRFRIIAFENADSGVYTTPKVISACIDNNTEQAFASVTYLGSSGTFYNEIMGSWIHHRFA